MKRLISLLLLLAMLSSVLLLAGCPSNDPGTGGGGGGGTGEKTFLDNLGDRNYNGDTFTVASGDKFAYEVYAEEDTTDILEEAVYKRNRALEDRFNVKIEHDKQINDTENNAMIPYFQGAYNSGDGIFDIAMVYVYRAGALVTDAMCYDQREWVPYVMDALNNGSEWWSKDINDAFTVQGHQYASVSDYCITAISLTYAMVFNKQIDDNDNISTGLNYESMYDIVHKGDWTIDLFRTIVKDRFEDVKENDTHDAKEDKFGFVTCGSTAIDQFAAAFNINYINNNGELTPELLTFSDRVVSAYDALYDLFHGPGKGTVIAGEGGTWSVDMISAFTEGRAFIVTMPLMRLSEDAVHEMDDDYGILPYPKLTESQSQYYSGTVDNYSVICIPAYHPLERIDMVGTMIEALSAETHNSVEEPYYDLIVTHNSTRDEASIPMIEIIMNGRLYDFATLHYSRLNYDHPTTGVSEGLGLLFRNALVAHETQDIKSVWDAISDQVQLRLDDLIADYVDMY